MRAGPRLRSLRALLTGLSLLSMLLATAPAPATAADDPVLSGFDGVWGRTDAFGVRGSLAQDSGNVGHGRFRDGSHQ